MSKYLYLFHVEVDRKELRKKYTFYISIYGYVVVFIIETCKTAYLEEPDTSPICYLFTRIVLLLKMNMKLEKLLCREKHKR